MSISYYLDKYVRQRPLFLSLIRSVEADLFQSYLPLNSPSLDLGCGDGFFAKVCFTSVDVGLDVEDSRISQTAKEHVYAKILTYDGRIIPLKSNTFSTIISNCVLEHVAALPEVLKEAYRVLKPDGKFIVTVMAHPWEDYLVGNLLLGSSYKNWMRQKQVHVNLLSNRQWQDKFTKAGFVVQVAQGYLSPKACKLLDIAHYLSLPSLMTYVLTGKWNLTSKINPYPTKMLAKIMSTPVSLNASGAIFFVLTKPNSRRGKSS